MTQHFHLWIYIWKKTKTVIQKDICTQMFIAALFTIAKIGKQSKCPLTEVWLKMSNVWACNGILFHYKKEHSFIICRIMDGLKGHYAKWKSQKGKDKYYKYLLYVESKQYNKQVNIEKLTVVPIMAQW